MFLPIYRKTGPPHSAGVPDGWGFGIAPQTPGDSPASWCWVAEGSQVRDGRLYEPDRVSGLWPHELHYRALSDGVDLPILLDRPDD